MHSENFQADFLKMASAKYATFKNTPHHLFYFIFYFILPETWFKCQNNEQNLLHDDTCWYVRLPNFKLRLISWHTAENEWMEEGRGEEIEVKLCPSRTIW